ncbi:MAG: hypothetical protein HY818_10590 [Acetobacterium woodii]|nr:hypothetical protein [Acetobacterium woodii]
MKFCSECGANVEGKKFCSECGKPVIEEAPAKEVPKVNIKTVDPKEETKQKIKRDNHRLLIGIAIFIAVCFVLSSIEQITGRHLSSTTPTTSKTTTQTVAKEPTEADFKAACVAQPYTDLARTPDSYKGMKIVVTGKVVQVMEKSNGAQYRVAVDGNYDQIFYVDYTGSFGQGRILENDMVTLWGTYDGLMSYTATLGGKITIPSLLAKYYQINK